MKPLAQSPRVPDLLSLPEDDDPREPGAFAASQLPRALHDDARAFLARPGKALRTRLVELAHALAGGAPGTLPDEAIEVIELLHGGSLIVDDIEDDAGERRGAPALHRLIGTPRALNTGNWLYFVALARLDALPLDAARARTLTTAAHHCLVRCHEGQALDLALKVSALKRAELGPAARCIGALKTGTLAGLGAQLGATLAGAPSGVVATLTRFGSQVGGALQMLDDLSGFVSERRADKALEDLRGERVSWVWTWADQVLDPLGFKQLVKQLPRQAELPALRARLSELVVEPGQSAVRAALDEARATLAPLAVPPALHASVDDALAHLEASYG